MARYAIKFSPSTTAYNYEVEANNAVEAEKIARELLEHDAGFGASKAWNCTDVIPRKTNWKEEKNEA